MSDIDLTGQVAVVTGGGRGLGRAMAQALAAAKAKVAVVARSQTELSETVALIQKDGGQALEIPVDVTDHHAVGEMVKTVQQKLGPIDLLVNNAGIFGPPGPVWEVDPDHWRRTLDVNLYGAFVCSAAVLKEMTIRCQGRIINVASNATLVPIPNASAYAVSKAALSRFTECLAADANDYGIVAFTIDPGTVETAMMAYLIESEEAQKWLPWIHRYFTEGGVFDSAERSTSLVVLLASGRLDRLSGRFIRISDNIDQLMLHADQVVQDDLYTLRLRTLPPENT